MLVPGPVVELANDGSLRVASLQVLAASFLKDEYIQMLPPQLQSDVNKLQVRLDNTSKLREDPSNTRYRYVIHF